MIITFFFSKCTQIAFFCIHLEYSSYHSLLDTQYGFQYFFIFYFYRVWFSFMHAIFFLNESYLTENHGATFIRVFLWLIQCSHLNLFFPLFFCIGTHCNWPCMALQQALDSFGLKPNFDWGLNWTLAFNGWAWVSYTSYRVGLEMGSITMSDVDPSIFSLGRPEFGLLTALFLMQLTCD